MAGFNQSPPNHRLGLKRLPRYTIGFSLKSIN
jgi:hypothetical protein